MIFFSGLQPAMGSNQQFLQPNNYDPRRLFPFGLSPIPEVPSELASEVSSIASYSPTPTLDDSDTEIESVRSRGSIMYSGSCDSVKSNVTLHGKSRIPQRKRKKRMRVSKLSQYPKIPHWEVQVAFQGRQTI